jgi:hypothetical protein
MKHFPSTLNTPLLLQDAELKSKEEKQSAR